MRTQISDHSQNVLEIQTFLRKMAQANMDIRFINPNGIFGTETTEAVKDGQRALALAVTGVVDAATWQAFREMYLKLQSEDA